MRVAKLKEAYPIAKVELWSEDEHRLGLKPTIRKVWSPIGQRPIVKVHQRYEWTYLYAFARRIANIAENEGVAERAAGKACEVVRLPGDQPASEVFGRAGERSRVRIRGLHPLGQSGIDRDAAIARKLEQTPRQIGVASRERCLDFTRRNRSIECTRQPEIGKQCRVVLGVEQPMGLEAARHRGKRGKRANAGQTERDCDPSYGHESVLPPSSVLRW